MKKKSILKRILLVLVAVLLIGFVGVDLYVGNYLCNYALGRAGDGGNRKVSLEVAPPEGGLEKTIYDNKALQKERNEAMLAQNSGTEVTITTVDDLTLSAKYYDHEDSHLWAITIHGYRGSNSSVMALTERYYSAGYNVLSPDLRCCGTSEGDYVGMGWLDKSDILRWIDWILEKDLHAKIVIHGISMGGATTMMVSGEMTPDAVYAFIEDCGYTSVWDIFASELKLRFGLPTFPALDTASLFAKVKAGYSFKEASSLNQVKNCEKPMLFIHGSEDGFVPFSMLDVLYNAKPGTNKEKLVAEGAGHGESVYALGEEYWTTVFSFLEKYR